MRLIRCCLIGCALLTWGAVSLPAQSFSLQSVSPNIARWMYPFNASPGNRATAPVFAAFGNVPDFDTRDGQYLLGWYTSNSIPVGQGPRNYLLKRVRVTLTLSADMQYAYDGALHDYRTYFPTNDPRYLTNASVSSPVELYGAGFRGGFTALTFQQASPFFASSTGGDYTNRNAFAVCYDTNGVLVDVSDNVGDDGTNELASAFEVSPFAIGNNANFSLNQLMPEGSSLTFDINLSDPLIYSYVQQGLNQGDLSFIASSLVNANYFSGTPNWPDLYTPFSVLADPDEIPLLDIEGTVVRTNLDTDNDGLPDDWEQFYFGALGAGATNSSAADGISNEQKYLAGTDPTDSDDDFRLLSIDAATNGTQLTFHTAPSRQYTLQWSEDLQNWQSVTNAALQYLSPWLTKTGTNLTYPAPVYTAWTDTNTAAGTRFYRVSVQ